jgi:4-amino-4-deoxy-L-arabinose transferase-like glycosyltransferase
MPLPQLSRTADSSMFAGSLIRAAGLIAVFASGFFALGLGDTPFVDEYAYITQSYQPDLVFAGRLNDPSWLDVTGYDLVPLPKYFINLAFRAAGLRRPTHRDAVAWYANTSYRWGSQQELLIARVPSIFAGALGCVAIFALGTLIAGPPAGVVAAFLLAVNPLFRLHAHRAMSEVSCEAFLLLALALGLWSWKTLLSRPPRTVFMVTMLLTGFSTGFSLLAKFNGALVIFALAGWTLLGLVLSRADGVRQLALCLGLAVATLTAVGTFVMFNPFMTAHPAGLQLIRTQVLSDMSVGERFLFLVEHRREVSRQQQQMFPHNAVLTGLERARVVAVQGFGRFGPLGHRKSDSTVRYDLTQDWGAIVWLPVVFAGLVWSILLGKRQLESGEPPTAWAAVVWGCLSVAVVAAYLPMAWDRYELAIQAPAALLAALPLASIARSFRNRLGSSCVSGGSSISLRGGL